MGQAPLPWFRWWLGSPRLVSTVEQAIEADRWALKTLHAIDAGWEGVAAVFAQKAAHHALAVLAAREALA